ncbi:MAG: zinc-ribbon domain-containing protein, partial [Gammaproteobacteria bacterium]
MITHCLECDTYFRVSAEQLKTANGQVKCGCCMTVFNALESLLDNSESAKNSDSSD